MASIASDSEETSDEKPSKLIHENGEIEIENNCSHDGLDLSDTANNTEKTEFTDSFYAYLVNLNTRGLSYDFNFNQFSKCNAEEIKSCVFTLIQALFENFNNLQFYRNIYKQIFVNALKTSANAKSLQDSLYHCSEIEESNIARNRKWDEIVMFGAFLVEIYKIQAIPMITIENWIVKLLPGVRDKNIKAEIALLLIMYRLSTDKEFNKSRGSKGFMKAVKLIAGIETDQDDEIPTIYESEPTTRKLPEIEEDPEHEETLAQLAINSTICYRFKTSLESQTKFDINEFEYITPDETEVCARIMIERAISNPDEIKHLTSLVYRYQEMLMSLWHFAKHVIQNCMKELNKFKNENVKMPSFLHSNYAIFFGELYTMDKPIIKIEDLKELMSMLMEYKNKHTIEALIDILRLCGRKLKIKDAEFFDAYLNYMKNLKNLRYDQMKIIEELESKILEDEKLETVFPTPPTGFHRIVSDFQTYLQLIGVNARNVKFDYAKFLDSDSSSRSKKAHAMAKSMLDKKTNPLAYAKFLKELFMLSYALSRFIKKLKYTFWVRIQKLKIDLCKDESSIDDNEGAVGGLALQVHKNVDLKVMKHLGLFIAHLANLLVIDRNNMNEYLTTMKAFDPANNAEMFKVFCEVLEVALLTLQTNNKNSLDDWLMRLDLWQTAQPALQSRIEKIKEKFQSVEIPKSFADIIFKARRGFILYNEPTATEFDDLEMVGDLARFFYINAISHPLMSENCAKILNIKFKDSSGKFRQELVRMCQTQFQKHFPTDNGIELNDCEVEDAIDNIIFIIELYKVKVLTAKIMRSVILTLEMHMRTSTVATATLKILVKTMKNEAELSQTLNEINRKLENNQLMKNVDHDNFTQLENEWQLNTVLLQEFSKKFIDIINQTIEGKTRPKEILITELDEIEKIKYLARAFYFNAISDPQMSENYARFLKSKSGFFLGLDSQHFKRNLISTCQTEFEKYFSSENIYKTDERHDEDAIGNIIFIAELYKTKFLGSSIFRTILNNLEKYMKISSTARLALKILTKIKKEEIGKPELFLQLTEIMKKLKETKLEVLLKNTQINTTEVPKALPKNQHKNVDLTMDIFDQATNMKVLTRFRKIISKQPAAFLPQITDDPYYNFANALFQLSSSTIITEVANHLAPLKDLNDKTAQEKYFIIAKDYIYRNPAYARHVLELLFQLQIVRKSVKKNYAVIEKLREIIKTDMLECCEVFKDPTFVTGISEFLLDSQRDSITNTLFLRIKSDKNEMEITILLNLLDCIPSRIRKTGFLRASLLGPLTDLQVYKFTNEIEAKLKRIIEYIDNLDKANEKSVSSHSNIFDEISPDRSETNSPKPSTSKSLPKERKFSTQSEASSNTEKSFSLPKSIDIKQPQPSTSKQHQSIPKIVKTNETMIEMEEDPDHEEILAQLATNSEICKSFKASLDGCTVFDINKFEFVTPDEIEVCARMMIERAISYPEDINRLITLVFNYQQMLNSLRHFPRSVVQKCLKELKKFEEQNFSTMTQFQYFNYANLFGELYMMDSAILNIEDIKEFISMLMEIDNKYAIEALVDILKLCGRKLKVNDDDEEFQIYFDYVKNSKLSDEQKKIMDRLEDIMVDDEEDPTIQEEWEEEWPAIQPVEFQRVSTDFRSYLRIINGTDRNTRFTRNTRFNYINLVNKPNDERSAQAHAMAKSMLNRKTNPLAYAKLLKELFMLSFAFGEFIKKLKRTFSVSIKNLELNLWKSQNLIDENEELEPKAFNNEDLKAFKHIGLFIAHLTNLFVIDRNNMAEYLSTMKAFDPTKHSEIFIILCEVFEVAFLGMQTMNEGSLDTWLTRLVDWHTAQPALRSRIEKISEKFQSVKIPNTFLRILHQARKGFIPYNAEPITELEELEIAEGLVKILYFNAISHPLMSESCAKVLKAYFSNSKYKMMTITMCQSQFEKHFSSEEHATTNELDTEDAIGNVVFIAELYKAKLIPVKIIVRVIEILELKMSNHAVVRAALRAIINTIKNEIDSLELSHKIKYIEKLLKDSIIIKTGNYVSSMANKNTRPSEKRTFSPIVIPLTVAKVYQEKLSAFKLQTQQSTAPQTIPKQHRQIAAESEFLHRQFTIEQSTIDESTKKFLEILATLTPLNVKSLGQTAIQSEFHNEQTIRNYAFLIKEFLYQNPHLSCTLKEFSRTIGKSRGMKKLKEKIQQFVEFDVYDAYVSGKNITSSFVLGIKLFFKRKLFLRFWSDILKYIDNGHKHALVVLVVFMSDNVEMMDTKKKLKEIDEFLRVLNAQLDENSDNEELKSIIESLETLRKSKSAVKDYGSQSDSELESESYTNPTPAIDIQPKLLSTVEKELPTPKTLQESISNNPLPSTSSAYQAKSSTNSQASTSQQSQAHQSTSEKYQTIATENEEDPEHSKMLDQLANRSAICKSFKDSLHDLINFDYNQFEYITQDEIEICAQMMIERAISHTEDIKSLTTVVYRYDKMIKALQQFPNMVIQECMKELKKLEEDNFELMSQWHFSHYANFFAQLYMLDSSILNHDILKELMTMLTEQENKSSIEALVDLLDLCGQKLKTHDAKSFDYFYNCAYFSPHVDLENFEAENPKNKDKRDEATFDLKSYLRLITGNDEHSKFDCTVIMKSDFTTNCALAHSAAAQICNEATNPIIHAKMLMKLHKLSFSFETFIKKLERNLKSRTKLLEMRLWRGENSIDERDEAVGDFRTQVYSSKDLKDFKSIGLFTAHLTNLLVIDRIIITEYLLAMNKKQRRDSLQRLEVFVIFCEVLEIYLLNLHTMHKTNVDYWLVRLSKYETDLPALNTRIEQIYENFKSLEFPSSFVDIIYQARKANVPSNAATIREFDDMENIEDLAKVFYFNAISHPLMSENCAKALKTYFCNSKFEKEVIRICQALFHKFFFQMNEFGEKTAIDHIVFISELYKVRSIKTRAMCIIIHMLEQHMLNSIIARDALEALVKITKNGNNLPELKQKLKAIESKLENPKSMEAESEISLMDENEPIIKNQASDNIQSSNIFDQSTNLKVIRKIREIISKQTNRTSLQVINDPYNDFAKALLKLSPSTILTDVAIQLSPLGNAYEKYVIIAKNYLYSDPTNACQVLELLVQLELVKNSLESWRGNFLILRSVRKNIESDILECLEIFKDPTFVKCIIEFLTNTHRDQIALELISRIKSNKNDAEMIVLLNLLDRLPSGIREAKSRRASLLGRLNGLLIHKYSSAIEINLRRFIKSIETLENISDQEELNNQIEVYHLIDYHEEILIDSNATSSPLPSTSKSHSTEPKLCAQKNNTKPFTPSVEPQLVIPQKYHAIATESVQFKHQLSMPANDKSIINFINYLANLTSQNTNILGQAIRNTACPNDNMLGIFAYLTKEHLYKNPHLGGALNEFIGTIFKGDRKMLKRGRKFEKKIKKFVEFDVYAICYNNENVDIFSFFQTIKRFFKIKFIFKLWKNILKYVKSGNAYALVALVTLMSGNEKMFTSKKKLKHIDVFLKVLKAQLDRNRDYVELRDIIQSLERWKESKEPATVVSDSDSESESESESDNEISKHAAMAVQVKQPNPVVCKMAQPSTSQQSTLNASNKKTAEPTKFETFDKFLREMNSQNVLNVAKQIKSTFNFNEADLFIYTRLIVNYGYENPGKASLIDQLKQKINGTPCFSVKNVNQKIMMYLEKDLKDIILQKENENIKDVDSFCKFFISRYGSIPETLIVDQWCFLLKKSKENCPKAVTILLSLMDGHERILIGSNERLHFINEFVSVFESLENQTLSAEDKLKLLRISKVLENLQSKTEVGEVKSQKMNLIESGKSLTVENEFEYESDSNNDVSQSATNSIPPSSSAASAMAVQESNLIVPEESATNTAFSSIFMPSTFSAYQEKPSTDDNSQALTPQQIQEIPQKYHAIATESAHLQQQLSMPANDKSIINFIDYLANLTPQNANVLGQTIRKTDYPNENMIGIFAYLTKEFLYKNPHLGEALKEFLSTIFKSKKKQKFTQKMKKFVEFDLFTMCLNGNVELSSFFQTIKRFFKKSFIFSLWRNILEYVKDGNTRASFALVILMCENEEILDSNNKSKFIDEVLIVLKAQLDKNRYHIDLQNIIKLLESWKEFREPATVDNDSESESESESDNEISKSATNLSQSESSSSAMADLSNLHTIQCQPSTSQQSLMQTSFPIRYQLIAAESDKFHHQFALQKSTIDNSTKRFQEILLKLQMADGGILGKTVDQSEFPNEHLISQYAYQIKEFLYQNPQLSSSLREFSWYIFGPEANEKLKQKIKDFVEFDLYDIFSNKKEMSSDFIQAIKIFFIGNFVFKLWENILEYIKNGNKHALIALVNLMSGNEKLFNSKKKSKHIDIFLNVLKVQFEQNKDYAELGRIIQSLERLKTLKKPAIVDSESENESESDNEISKSATNLSQSTSSSSAMAVQVNNLVVSEILLPAQPSTSQQSISKTTYTQTETKSEYKVSKDENFNLEVIEKAKEKKSEFKPETERTMPTRFETFAKFLRELNAQNVVEVAEKIKSTITFNEADLFIYTRLIVNFGYESTEKATLADQLKQKLNGTPGYSVKSVNHKIGMCLAKDLKEIIQQKGDAHMKDVDKFCKFFISRYGSIGDRLIFDQWRFLLKKAKENCPIAITILLSLVDGHERIFIGSTETIHFINEFVNVLESLANQTISAADKLKLLRILKVLKNLQTKTKYTELRSVIEFHERELKELSKSTMVDNESENESDNEVSKSRTSSISSASSAASAMAFHIGTELSQSSTSSTFKLPNQHTVQPQSSTSQQSTKNYPSQLQSITNEKPISQKYQLIAAENAEFHRKFTSQTKFSPADDSAKRFKEILALLTHENANSLGRTDCANEFKNERLFCKKAFLIKEYLYKNPHLGIALKKFSLKLREKSQLKIKIKEFVEFDVYEMSKNGVILSLSFIQAIQTYFNRNFIFQLWRNLLEYVSHGNTHALISLVMFMNRNETKMWTKKKSTYIHDFLKVLKAQLHENPEYGELKIVIKSLETIKQSKISSMDAEESESETESENSNSNGGNVDFDDNDRKNKNIEEKPLPVTKVDEQRNEVQATPGVKKIISKQYAKFDNLLRQINPQNVVEIGEKIKPTLRFTDSDLSYYARLIVDYGYENPEIAPLVDQLRDQWKGLNGFRTKSLKLKIEQCVEKDLSGIIERKKGINIQNFCKFFTGIYNTVKDSFIFFQWRYLITFVRENDALALTILLPLMDGHESIATCTEFRKDLAREFIRVFENLMNKPLTAEDKTKLQKIIRNLKNPQLKTENIKVNEKKAVSTINNDKVNNALPITANKDIKTAEIKNKTVIPEIKDAILLTEFKNIINTFSTKPIKDLELATKRFRLLSPNEMNDLAEFFHQISIRADDLSTFAKVAKIISDNMAHFTPSFKTTLVQVTLKNFEKFLTDYNEARNAENNGALSLSAVEIIMRSETINRRMSQFIGHLFNQGLMSFTEIVRLIYFVWNVSHVNLFELSTVLTILETSNTKLLLTIRDEKAGNDQTNEEFQKNCKMLIIMSNNISKSDFCGNASVSLTINEVSRHLRILSQEILREPEEQLQIESLNNDPYNQLQSNVEKFNYILNEVNENNLMTSINRISVMKNDDDSDDIKEIIKIFYKICDTNEENMKMATKLMKHVRVRLNPLKNPISVMNTVAGQFPKQLKLFISQLLQPAVIATDLLTCFKLTNQICQFYHSNLIELDCVNESLTLFSSNMVIFADLVFSILESTGADMIQKNPEWLLCHTRFYRGSHDDYVLRTIANDLNEMGENYWTLKRRVEGDIFEAYLSKNVSIATLKLHIIEKNLQPDEFVQNVWKQLIMNPAKAVDLADNVFDVSKLFAENFSFIFNEFMEQRRQAFLRIPKISFATHIQQKLKSTMIFILELYKFEVLTENLDKWIHPSLVEKLTETNDKIEISKWVALVQDNYEDTRSSIFRRNLDNEIADHLKINLYRLMRDLNQLKEEMEQK